MSILSYLAVSRDVIEASERHAAIQNVDPAAALIVMALAGGKPLLVCGNGGSAADAMHITAELVGRFLAERKALNCICLASNPSVLTAWSNDYSFDTVFARQVEAYGQSGGVILGLSTSGNSSNIVKAFETAHALGMRTIGLTGEGGGKLAAHSDILIDVPSRTVPLIQQVHIVLYHYLCEQIEAAMMQTV